MDIEQILSSLTLEEKAALVSGTDFMYTNPVPRLGIPSVRMSDGPHGLRVQSEKGDNGVNGSEPSTAFPTASCSASSWNPENVYKIGRAMAEEANHYGIDVVLGPGANIKRNPLGGRNFEYFSEDPLLSGKMASAEVKGLQEQGVSATLKHFALNNSENYRFMGNSVADMRAIREIYLKSFEYVVKEAHPDAVMCSYNQINGTYACQNKWLLTDVLRQEWGYKGLVMTDWGATHDRVAMLQSGLDLEMPGDTDICRKWIIDAVRNGNLDASYLDKAVRSLLTLVDAHTTKETSNADFVAHHALAEEIAIDSAALLKNDGSLPLAKGVSCCVIGELFEKARYQGAGSSMINPLFLSTPKTAFDEKGIEYVYEKGYKENETEPNQSLIEKALEAAEKHDTVLLFLGLTDYVESEGCDRESMSLPKNQLALVEALIKAEKKIVVILYGGSPVELPFFDNVSSILDMYLPGQNGGGALVNLLFGEKNPSGKLAETWPMKYEDVPFFEAFGKREEEIYKESILVGYRYYLNANKKVRFPFGYGLSYTNFEYEDMALEENGDKLLASCLVRNVGTMEGGEVVEVYVSLPNSKVFRPLRELKGFKKVYLKPNENKRVYVEIAKEDLRYWDVKENRFILEEGIYDFQICRDCQTVLFSQSIKLDGEKISSPYSPQINDIYGNGCLEKVDDSLFEGMSGLKLPKPHPILPITLESRFSYLQRTFMGRILHNAVLSVAKKDMKKAKKLKEGPERDNKIKGALFLKRILESNSIITMSMSAGHSFPYNVAVGMVELANGHLYKGIKSMCTKINVPALPKQSKEGK